MKHWKKLSVCLATLTLTGIAAAINGKDLDQLLAGVPPLIASNPATAVQKPVPSKPVFDDVKPAAGTLEKGLTNQTQLNFKLKTVAAGWNLRFFAGPDATSAVDDAYVMPLGNQTWRVNFNSFHGQQRHRIACKWELEGVVSEPSDPVQITFDTVGPMADVKFTAPSGGVGVLAVEFAEADLNVDTVKAANFIIRRSGGGASFNTTDGFEADSPSLSQDGKVASITLKKFVPDNYQLVLGPGLKDAAGNSAGFRDRKLDREQVFYFSAYPDREKGKHVEFPDFVKRQRSVDPSEFNPGDKVETRVARLYYYRDAHRVAEIINRNVKSYNRAAVDQKRREAESSRGRADTATDDRRAREREAIQAAQEARQAERDVISAEAAAARARSARDQAQTSFETASQQLTHGENSVTQLQQAKTRAEDARNKLDPKDSNYTNLKLEADRRVAAISSELKDTQDEAARLKRVQTDAASAASDAAADVREKESELNAAQAKLETKRNAEIAKREESLQSEAKEDRAREDQFRKEVAAAHEDPDTYVPGKVDSIDAVTQVSISVIGEGLIQLRGPIRGINRIRTMIDQIDSPVGQVKVGIFTVQVNGEHGDRMEKVAQRIEGNVDLSRFLTSQSMMLLRRSVQEVASEVAQECDYGGHRQRDRDRKYLYNFFGRDFVDELFAMDSEFLQSGNKVLSLHSMDTVSRSSALFVTALAKNSIRQRILDRFMYLIDCELPKAEYDFRKASKILPCGRNTYREIQKKAQELYRFRSLRGMFDVPLADDQRDVMTPMQREFIRLAQIFKSQMVAEIELKQRVIERALIEDRANDDELRFRMLDPVHRVALGVVRESYEELVGTVTTLQKVERDCLLIIAALNAIPGKAEEQSRMLARGNEREQVLNSIETVLEKAREADKAEQTTFEVDGKTYTLSYQDEDVFLRDPKNQFRNEILSTQATLEEYQKRLPAGLPAKARIQSLTNSFSKIDITSDPPEQIHLGNLLEVQGIVASANRVLVETEARGLTETLKAVESSMGATSEDSLKIKSVRNRLEGKIRSYSKSESLTLDDPSALASNLDTGMALTREVMRAKESKMRKILLQAEKTRQIAEGRNANLDEIAAEFEILMKLIDEVGGTDGDKLRTAVQKAFASILEVRHFPTTLKRAESLASTTRQQLDHRKLLDFLIDEQEEKSIDLREGTKSHIATMDNYLKRLAIALEDDFKVQFYDPAFAEIRKAAREWDVNLGQVERTTILTNNRAFAKVSPQATMEFDLPKRDILIKEAMQGAQALVQDYGALLQDPTFLSATKMLSGSPTSSVSSGAKGNVPGLPSQGQPGPGVKNVLPGLPSSSEEQVLNQSGGQERELGSALEALIPDPAIYKFETGTGFEIRPVIQPDGDSIIYDFNYMYTTNVREPVRADEKHLGRVKRHFIDTQVQTSSFELREISRYQVALKVSRTSRGVPLLEDIPGVGVLFRPQPSAESSLQQNIILGQSTVYPTLFDLMGLRWAPHVVDLNHASLLDAEHVIRGRRKTISDFVFDEASERVDDFLGIERERPTLHRTDLYRRQNVPSPHHPSGYSARCVDDPTCNEHFRPDRRPSGFREPTYDDKRGIVVEDDDDDDPAHHHHHHGHPGSGDSPHHPHDHPGLQLYPSDSPGPALRGQTSPPKQNSDSTTRKDTNRANAVTVSRGQEPSAPSTARRSPEPSSQQSNTPAESSRFKKLLNRLRNSD